MWVCEFGKAATPCRRGCFFVLRAAAGFDVAGATLRYALGIAHVHAEAFSAGLSVIDNACNSDQYHLFRLGAAEFLTCIGAWRCSQCCSLLRWVPRHGTWRLFNLVVVVVVDDTSRFGASFLA